MSEATDNEMLAAVEQWALSSRIYGWAVAGMDVPPREEVPENARNVDRWMVQVMDGGVRIAVIANGTVKDVRIVDPHTALVWALAVEDGGTVDTGRCPTCVQRSLPERKLATMEWTKWSWFTDVNEHILEHATEQVQSKYEDGAWSTAAIILTEGATRIGVAVVCSRPCPDCNGTGRHDDDLARLVLDAAEREVGFDYGYPRGPLFGHAPEAREHLHVEAERRQAGPFGRWLALWLGDGSRSAREGTAEAVYLLEDLALRKTLAPGPGVVAVETSMAVRKGDAVYVRRRE